MQDGLSIYASQIETAFHLLNSGEAGQAEAVLLAYCEQSPHDPAGWYLLGASLHAQRRTAAALARMERSLEIEPDQPEVLKATAILLQELSRFHAGLERAERACTLAPDDPNTWLIAGSLLEALENGEEALQRYEHALALNPDWKPALLNRGALLMGLARHGQALENYRKLAQLYPKQADSFFNLAEAQLACGDFEDAAASCRRALQFNPLHVGASIDLALALSMLGEFETARGEFAAALELDRDAAVEHFRRAISADGADANTSAPLIPEEVFLWRHGEMQRFCDWRYRQPWLEAIEACADKLKSGKETDFNGPLNYFRSLALPLSAGRQHALARGVAAGVIRRAGAGKPQPAPSRYRHIGGPLRIGYLSPDYRLHPVAYSLWRQLELHDRSRFRVFAYSLHPDDGSEVRQKVRESCDEWRNCENDPVALTAARLRYDGIQILIDRSGYTRLTRPEILALRPAPIQVAYMGMPASSGASFIDYRFTDAVTTSPEEAVLWSELLVYLPSTLFMCNNEQETGASPSRAEAGLPEAAFVFCCFNNAFKIEPDVFGIWMRLLRAIPGSVLWLLSDEAAVRENLRREAEARGVDAGRLIFAQFLPFSDHLARYPLADLFLDTFYYGAHTTAADALRAGLPVITCLGQTMASRQAASIVNAAGLPELVAATHEEYEVLAHRLAVHPDELGIFRRRLLDNRRHSPLLDTEGRVRELERAYEMMWERHESGLPPASFAVAPGGGTPG